MRLNRASWQTWYDKFARPGCDRRWHSRTCILEERRFGRRFGLYAARDIAWRTNRGGCDLGPAARNRNPRASPRSGGQSRFPPGDPCRRAYSLGHISGRDYLQHCPKSMQKPKRLVLFGPRKWRALRASISRTTAPTKSWASPSTMPM